MRLIVIVLVCLAGCQNAVQTTSGAAYLAARPQFDAQAGTPLDQAVARAAATEPLLRFPARFGLARIDGGQVAAVPPREADAWIAFAQAHPEYGSFVAISPLVTEMAAAPAGDAARTAADRIRLGAARQHVDAVLIYTVAGGGRNDASPLSLLDLTIVGAFLVPSRSVGGEATASGLLLDVRNGYPYGTATATGSATGLVPAVGSNRASDGLKQNAQVEAVGKLVAQVESMMARLRTGLAAGDAAPSTVRTLKLAPART